jgi:hypothetical protein
VSLSGKQGAAASPSWRPCSCFVVGRGRKSSGEERTATKRKTYSLASAFIKCPRKSRTWARNLPGPVGVCPADADVSPLRRTRRNQRLEHRSESARPTSQLRGTTCGRSDSGARLVSARRAAAAFAGLAGAGPAQRVGGPFFSAARSSETCAGRLAACPQTIMRAAICGLAEQQV